MTSRNAPRVPTRWRQAACSTVFWYNHVRMKHRFRTVLVLALLLAAAPLRAAPDRTLDSLHFTVYYEGDRLFQAETVRLSAETSYAKLRDLLGWAPPGKIPIFLYTDREAFRQSTGVKRKELVVGVATSADDAIRIDAASLFDSPDNIVGHELVHIFLFRFLGSNINELPLYIHEGLAQEAGNAPKAAALTAVIGAWKDRGLIPLSDIRRDFPRDDTGHLAYDQGQTVVQFLLERGGWPRIRALLNLLRTGVSFDTALRQTYSFDSKELETAWRATIRQRAQPSLWNDAATGAVVGVMVLALGLGYLGKRKKRQRLARQEAEEAVEEMEVTAPPSWWKEDEWKV